MTERDHVYEKVGGLIGAGLVALALSGCYAPKDTKGYYEPFTDKIYYNGTPEPEIVAHEQIHQKRANEYSQGRWAWGIRYAFDKDFACAEELEAGADMNHPACK